jgi:thioredoxin 1
MRIIDQQTFSNELLQDQSGMIYVIDFFAEWCGPCKMLAPVLEDVQAQYQTKITIVKLDIDANQELAEELQIMSIPTVMIYRNGQKLETVT